MGLISGINNAWIPYWYQEKKRYDTVQHLDRDKEILNSLEHIYKWGGILPIMSSYIELDKVNKKITILYSKL